MEEDLKRCIGISKLLQSQVNMIENQVLQLKTNNMFLITQLRELQWDAEKQMKSPEKQNRKNDKESELQKNDDDDTKNQLDSLHKQVQELEARNVYLCEKLAEFEWDEEKQIQLSMLQKRRENALIKVRLQYESDKEKKKKNGYVESSDESGDDYYGDEIDC